MEDPWSIQSLFELQFFVCPSCAYKNNSKQEFVYHAYNIHPESIEKLKIINDDSISDVNCPWNEIEIKEETVSEQTDIEDNMDNCQNGEMLEIFKEDLDPLDETENDFQNEESFIQNNDHKCQYCAEIFDDHITLKKHIRLLCPNLDDNTRKHLGIKPLSTANQDKNNNKCKYCGKEYSKIKTLRTHINYHHGAKSILEDCQICGKSLKAIRMPRHIRIWHDGNRDKYKCEKCGKGFSTPPCLRTHIRDVSTYITSFSSNFFLYLSHFSNILLTNVFATFRFMKENCKSAKNVIKNLSVEQV